MENSIQRTLADDGTATVSVRGEIDFSNSDEVAHGHARRRDRVGAAGGAGGSAAAPRSSIRPAWVP